METLNYFNLMVNQESTVKQAVNKFHQQETQQYTSIPEDADGKPDYEVINERALGNIDEVIEWLELDGKQVGSSFQFLNPKRADYELGSCSVNIEKGVWKDFADFEGKAAGRDLVSLVAYIKAVRQHEAAKLLWGFLESSESDSTHVVKPFSKRIISNQKAVDDLILVMPIPDDAPSIPSRYTGSGTTIYRYLNAEGQLMCQVLRFDKGNGEKSFCPLTLWRNAEGHLAWETKAPPTPRPLYGLNHLAAHPQGPVMIVEGEKAADAAAQLFPDHVVVTTMNGAQSPDKSDFTPLQGRQVFIWPDNDEPGQKYAETVIDILRSIDSDATVSVMTPITMSPGIDSDGNPVLAPGFIAPEGWDAADAVAQGWAVDHIKLLPADTFILAPTGVGAITHDKAGKNKVSIKQSGIPDQVKAFLCGCFPAGLVYFNNSFHAYQDGYWPSLNEQAEVRHVIAKFLGEDATPDRIGNMLTLTRDFQSRLNDHTQPDRNLICLSNGTLNTRTSELIEHNPDHNLRTKTDIEWDPNASCNRFMQFLDEIFANDVDKAEKILFVQEWLGYCLIPDNSQHKFVWMVGSGGNGKSVLLAILTHLIGSKNITNAAIEDLGKTFVRAELEGKLVNISSEMSASATMADSYLKAIVSGDTVQAERKYQPSFSFRPFVRLIAATNHLPRLLDLSDGFFRRAIILTFNIRISDENKDPHLEQKLVAELPGILVWAVRGLERLRNNDRFTVLPSSVQELEKYRDESDTEKLFADECLESVTQRGLPPSTIYEGYVEWCKKNGFHAKSSVGFGRRLGELGYNYHRPGGKKYWLVAAREDNGYFNDYFATQAVEDTAARLSGYATKLKL